jgi:hypothetical protein
MKNKQARKKLNSTQEQIYIAAIRNNVVILKDGALRAVLEVNSINFGLKSEDEQVGLINSYVSFLNTLKYPLQIVIQSRKFNIKSYLEALKEQEKVQVNDLLRKQIGEYRNYIVDLIEMGDIMSKKFYVIVPYSAKEDMEMKSFWARLTESFTPAVKITLSQQNFLKKHRDLMLRVNNVMSGLGGVGLKPKLLTTQELISLYYNLYNPADNSDATKMDDMSKIRYDII